MDSVTQLVLGGVVATAIGGKTLGRKAALWGAALGTLPDLDILMNFWLNDVEQVVYHRGISHAFFYQILIAPILAWLISTIHQQKKHYKHWLLIVIGAFITHSIIDWFTVYGTKIFLPFTDYPYALGNLFIIDPLFTLPLLIAFIANLIRIRSPRYSIIALSLVTGYAIFAYALQQQALNYTKQNLAQQGINTQQIMVSPMPFSIFYWRIVAITEQNWYEGMYSSIEENKDMHFAKRSKAIELLPVIKHSWSLQQLQHFTKGFFQLSVSKDKATDNQYIVLSDLRMGFAEMLFFNYRLAIWNKNTNTWQPLTPATRQNRPQVSWSEITKLF